MLWCIVGWQSVLVVHGARLELVLVNWGAVWQAGPWWPYLACALNGWTTLSLPELDLVDLAYIDHRRPLGAFGPFQNF